MSSITELSRTLRFLNSCQGAFNCLCSPPYRKNCPWSKSIFNLKQPKLISFQIVRKTKTKFNKQKKLNLVIFFLILLSGKERERNFSTRGFFIGQSWPYTKRFFSEWVSFWWWNFSFKFFFYSIIESRLYIFLNCSSC